MATRLSRCLPPFAASFALIGALSGAPVFAQTTPPASPAAPTAPAAPIAAPVAAHVAPVVARGRGMVERRISDLHSQLKITPSQQPAFDAFAGVMRDNADRMTGILQDRRKSLATMTALDQMKGYQEVAQAHADDMQRLVPAFERLYEALTPEQKKLADLSFRDFATSAGRGRV